jgi:hypothetical protein
MTILVEEVIKESFKNIKSEALDNSLEEFRKKIQEQYNSASALPSNYSLALEKYNEIKRLLTHAYTEKNMGIAGSELGKAAQLVLDFRIDEREFTEFYAERINLGKLLLCNSWIYTGFWRLLIETKNKNVLLKLKGYRESAELIIRAIEDLSDYISLKQWEDIHQVGLFFQQATKAVKNAKRVFNYIKKLNQLAGYILWKSQENISFIEEKYKEEEKRKRAIRFMKKYLQETENKLKEEVKLAEKNFDIFKEIVDKGRARKLYQ